MERIAKYSAKLQVQNEYQQLFISNRHFEITGIESCLFFSAANVHANPNITPEFIDNHPEVNWNWRNLSGNKSITEEYIDKHSDKPWNWEFMTLDRNFSPDFISKYSCKWNTFSRYYISCNSNLTVDDFLSLPNFEWVLEAVISNIKITSEFIRTYDCISRYIDELSANPNIVPSIIEEYPVDIWNWNEISKHGKITIQFLEKYRDRVSWEDLSCNPNVTSEFILHFPNEDWEWERLYKNENIHVELFAFGQNENFVISSALSYSPNLTVEMVEYYELVDWKWDVIAHKSTDIIRFIELLSDVDWDWSHISRNTAISIDYIVKNPNFPWNMNIVLRNSFYFYEAMLADVLMLKMIDNRELCNHIVERTQHPEKVLQQLNKFQYNVGTEEYNS